MNDPLAPPFDELLMRRIYGEYLEMPGLQLTSGQARRLFGLAEQLCEPLLDHMVHRGLLARRPNGMYARHADGNASMTSSFPRHLESIKMSA